MPGKGVRAKARRKLRSVRRHEFSRLLEAARKERMEKGGCLGHQSQDCPHGPQRHRKRARREHAAAVKAATNTLVREHVDLYARLYAAVAGDG